jgi:hypothetical protein
MSELHKLILTPVALLLFLAAAQNAGGLSWRVETPAVVVAAVR